MSMTWASFLRLGVTPSHSPRFRVEIRAQFPSKIEFLVNPPALAHIVQALFFFFFLLFRPRSFTAATLPTFSESPSRGCSACVIPSVQLLLQGNQMPKIHSFTPQKWSQQCAFFVSVIFSDHFLPARILYANILFSFVTFSPTFLCSLFLCSLLHLAAGWTFSLMRLYGWPRLLRIPQV